VVQGRRKMCTFDKGHAGDCEWQKYFKKGRDVRIQLVLSAMSRSYNLDGLPYLRGRYAQRQAGFDPDYEVWIDPSFAEFTVQANGQAYVSVRGPIRGDDQIDGLATFRTGPQLEQLEEMPDWVMEILQDMRWGDPQPLPPGNS